MSNELMITITLICVCILSVAGMLINRIRLKKGKLADEEDMVTKLLDKQKLKLSRYKSVIQPATYIVLNVACVVAILILMFVFTHNIFVAVLCSFIGFFIPDIFVKAMQGKNSKKWDERFARTLTQMSASLRAGLTIPQAINEICTSPFIHDSVKKEFEIMRAGLLLNKTSGQVFTEFAERTGNDDVSDLAAAIRLQEKIGGSEAAVVENIAKNISDRLVEKKKIDAKLAETNMTVKVFDILPFGIILIMCLAAKDFMGYYFESFSHFIIFLVIIGVMIVGSIINRVMFGTASNVGNKKKKHKEEK